MTVIAPFRKIAYGTEYFILLVLVIQKAGFPRNHKANRIFRICLSLEEVALCAGHKVLMEVDSNYQIVGDPRGILNQQLRPRQSAYKILLLLLY